MRPRLSLVLATLLAAFAFSGCIFVHDGDGVADVSLSVSFATRGVQVVVYNDNPYPVTVRWAQSSYVYQDGYTDFLAVLDYGATDAAGIPLDQVIGPHASGASIVAPEGAIDPYTGEVWIPDGPPGSAISVLVSVVAEGEVATLEYVYPF